MTEDYLDIFFKIKNSVFSLNIDFY